MRDELAKKIIEAIPKNTPFINVMNTFINMMVFNAIDSDIPEDALQHVIQKQIETLYRVVKKLPKDEK